jgi:MSHA biogenesis protein MshM
MYMDHFGLQELPFTLTPNTRFFLQLPAHQEALNLVLVALSGGDGFIKVVGEVGTGKTMLCRTLLNTLDEQDYITAYLPNPFLNPEALRQHFALEIGIEEALELGDVALMARINEQLIAHAREGRHTVLIVDEAQAMPEETIEALRLLTNLETESEKLFQVVLLGQPELDTLLAQQSLRQLKQRITFSCRLHPLADDAVELYLQQRATRAGYNGLSLFSKKAVRLLSESSAGIPRLVNILAHKALMSAYGKGDVTVSAFHVMRAIDDTEGVTLPNHYQQWLWKGLAIALISAGVLYAAQSRGLL